MHQTTPVVESIELHIDLTNLMRVRTSYLHLVIDVDIVLTPHAVEDHLQGLRLWIWGPMMET